MGYGARHGMFGHQVTDLRPQRHHVSRFEIGIELAQLRGVTPCHGAMNGGRLNCVRFGHGCDFSFN